MSDLDGTRCNKVSVNILISTDNIHLHRIIRPLTTLFLRAVWEQVFILTVLLLPTHTNSHR